MFSHSRDFVITGGVFTSNVTGERNLAFEKLQKASAPSAFHNSSARFDPPKCHPNTRVAILEYLIGWIYGHNDIDALILWLYGPAGAGKSAILQTIAERCFERNAILASFFFSRSDSSRNTFKPLIATLAYQIATTIPELKPYIESAIERDPLLFDKSVDTQLQLLIVRPFKALAALGHFNGLANWARLVLIDGLDECDDPRMQRMILRTLANALRDQQLPLIFLIASRPEQHILSTFNSPPLSGLWKSLVLDDSFRPNEDIRLFLTDSFRDITATHPYCSHIPAVWPQQSDVDELVTKSSGQFIYASVVMKYISAHDDLPPRRLEVARGLGPARRELPFAELDALYMHIMGACKDPDTILSILGYIVSTFTLYPNNIELLLDLEPGEVMIALFPLYSVLNLPTPWMCSLTLSHASFGDFLTDISRSGKFYIDITAVIDNGFSICVSKIMQPPSKMIQNMSHDVRNEVLAQIQDMFSFVRISPVTEASEDILKGFSLPQFWTSWSNEDCKDILRITYDFLEACRGGRDQRRGLYDFHRVSLEPSLSSKLTEYYNDAGLLSLVVASTFLSGTYPRHLILESLNAEDDPILDLLELTQKSITFDHRNLQLSRSIYSMDWFRHFPYQYTSSGQSSGLDISRADIAKTALQILKFLCTHPPHPLQCQKRPRKYTTRKPPSDHHKMPTWARHFQSAISQKKRLTDIGFLRKRREEKHRYGNKLFSPNIIQDVHNGDDWAKSCLYGLILLPRILGEASEAAELKFFIKTHGKDIVPMPKYTRPVVDAMYEYLCLQ